MIHLGTEERFRVINIKKVNQWFFYLKVAIAPLLGVAFVMPLLLAGWEIFLPFFVAYIAVLFRLNFLLRDEKLNYIWLAASVCLPFIGVLVSFAGISRAVGWARRKNGIL